ncbi:Uu.00g029220.m01.CDS01 [Anthostomella pinea]|uniref:Uu.00g029220.m01.CDS01 n=1 Tax=Anthostomella pinea TaxID=933095 RepID=A0AAI8YAG5_9PEZI|nr:Uu.00g029220.m01.CDS01 [Anthostomella pinea]
MQFTTSFILAATLFAAVHAAPLTHSSRQAATDVQQFYDHVGEEWHDLTHPF